MNTIKKTLSVSVLALLGALGSISNVNANGSVDGSGCVVTTNTAIDTASITVSSAETHGSLISGSTTTFIHNVTVNHTLSSLLLGSCGDVYDIELSASNTQSGSPASNTAVGGTVDTVTLTVGGSTEETISAISAASTNLKVTLNFTADTVTTHTDFNYKVPVELVAKYVEK